MAININNLFPITPAVINTGGAGLSFAGNFLTNNTLVPNNIYQSTLQFFSADAVGAFFGLSSDEYLKCAVPYFKGFDNSQIKPSYILFTRNIAALVDAYLYGGKVTAPLSAFTAITTGSIVLNINGTPTTVSSINLGTATSYSQVASLLQTAIRGTTYTAATVTYDSNAGAFVLHTGLTTGTDTISWASAGSLATLLNWTIYTPTTLTITSGAGYLSQGSAILTDAQNLAKLNLLTANFACFTNVFDVSSDTTNAFALDAAAWASAHGYAYVQWIDTTVADEVAFNTTLIADNYSNVIPNYGNLNIASFVMSMGACVNYTAANSVISYAFKTQSGLTPIDINNSDSQTMVQDKINFYGDYISQAISYPSTVNFYQQGRITGQFVFAQNFMNQMWLANSLQNALIALFANSRIVGYNPQGYSLINAALESVMLQAVVNGVVTTGNTFSPDQKAILIQQAGLDITPMLTNSGYYIKIQPVTGDQRASNTPPPTTIWYTNGGVILTLPVSTVFVL